MTLKRFGKKLLKFTGILLGVLIVLLVCFHFWFIHHAKQLLEDTVSEKSNGRLQLKIDKLSYNYFTQRMVIKKAVFFNTDTATAATSNRFEVKEINLKLRALLPLIFNKRLLIDSLNLQSPNIQVTKLRFNNTDTLVKKNKGVSIPYEMGKIYKSIQEALEVLHVSRFQIDDGKFTLINKAQPDQLPLHISNINFHIDNFRVDSTHLTGKEKILFSDNIVLRSNDQNIIFPDGRHRLNFSRFRINLKKKLVEFDSCTIEATRTDTAASKFKVFFDALLLTNIDFDTLYRSDVIKADSVYCVNPRFDLDLVVGKKKNPEKTTPRLERIIQQLTGDLLLKFVVVENANFNIRTVKDDNPTTFTFSHNNLEIQGLSINQDAERPLKVKSLAMAIRNYENFIKDSAYSVKFDSVVIKGDQITLNNFVFNKLDNGRILNTFSIPQFKLVGMSLDALIIERRLRARQATMFNPHISYTAQSNQQNRQKKNIFQSLGAVNEYMDLDELEIVNGDIDLHLNKNLSIKLDEATLSIQSHSLLTSTKLAGIKNSLNSLEFKRGRINAGNIYLDLDNIYYTGHTGSFNATAINVTNKESNLAVALKGVSVDQLKVDEATGNIFAQGISWKNADIKTSSLPNSGTESTATIDIHDIRGGPTNFSGIVNGKSITTKLNSISLTELIKKPGEKLELKNLSTEGQAFSMKDKQQALTVDRFSVKDDHPSTFQNAKYKSESNKLSANIEFPSLTATPHIQSLLKGEIDFDNISSTKPLISITQKSNHSSSADAGNNMSSLNISNISLSQPHINFTRESDTDTVVVSWQGEKDPANYFQANGISSIKGNNLDLKIDKAQFNLSNFIYTATGGKRFSTGNGKTAAHLKNISLQKNENQDLDWKATVSDFTARDFKADSLGKSKGNLVLNSAALKELNIGSALLNDKHELVAANPLFQLENFTGRFSTGNTVLKWYNAGFESSNKTFSLDSFQYSPMLEKDSFIATRKFQTDYIKLNTGALHIGPVDIDKYISDTSLSIQKLEANNVVFIDFKDKNLPFNSGLIKPLPVDLIQKIPVKFALDSVVVNNGMVQYTEINEKTQMPGSIPITRMTVLLRNVKNHHLASTDSLIMKANGYIMDTVWTRLRVRESYTDSLGGFVMTLRLKPGDLTVLNSALIPLASVKLLSGKLDTLSMRAVGREYLALGEMKMFYNDLKIQFLKDGGLSKRTIFNKLMTFFVNTFVIRKNNRSRIGDVFFIRHRDRSAINYLIRIAMSGMASSIGAKDYKKMIRRYKEELERKKLPAVDSE